MTVLFVVTFYSSLIDAQSLDTVSRKERLSEVSLGGKVLVMGSRRKLQVMLAV